MYQETSRWRWVLVGTATVTVFWILGSIAFSIYVAFSGSYSATYGSIGAVVVVLEGFGESELTADWGGGEDNTMTYPVAPLDEELSAFFKG